jgi:NAD(P)-dependent dehydrogenase (short-subunit alcohol dehydrogenase family)
LWEIAKAEEVVKLIRATGGKAVAVAGDIMAKETIEKVINVAAELGGGKIHCIVNNVYFLSPPAFSCVLRKGGKVIEERGQGG